MSRTAPSCLASLRQHRRERGIDEQHRGAAVLEDIGDLRRGQTRVQRHRDATRRRHGEQVFEIAVAVQCEDRGAVTLAQTATPQPAGETRDPLLGVAPDAAAVAEDRRNAGGPGLRRALQTLGQMHPRPPPVMVVRLGSVRPGAAAERSFRRHDRPLSETGSSDAGGRAKSHPRLERRTRAVASPPPDQSASTLTGNARHRLSLRGAQRRSNPLRDEPAHYLAGDCFVATLLAMTGSSERFRSGWNCSNGNCRPTAHAVEVPAHREKITLRQQAPRRQKPGGAASARQKIPSSQPFLRGWMIGVSPVSGFSPSAAFSRRRCASFCGSTTIPGCGGVCQNSSLLTKLLSALLHPGVRVDLLADLVGRRRTRRLHQGVLARAVAGLRRAERRLRHQRLLCLGPLRLLHRAWRAGTWRAQREVGRHRQRCPGGHHEFVRRVTRQAEGTRKGVAVAATGQTERCAGQQQRGQQAPART